MSLTSYRAAPPRGIGGCLGLWLGMRLGLLLPFGRPGGDLLSHVLGRSTIGAEGFHGRVRDGIGCMAPRHDHQVVGTEDREQRSEAYFCSLSSDLWRMSAVFVVEVWSALHARIWSLHATEGFGSSRTSD